MGMFLLLFSLPSFSAHNPDFSILSSFDSSTSTILISFRDDRLSFDITGSTSSGSSITTSYSGYSALLRIGSFLSPIISGSSATISSISLSIHSHQLSPNSLLLFFRLSNSGSETQLADVGISSFVLLDDDDSAPISALPLNQGFVVHSQNSPLTFILADHPIVTDISTFWYGARGSASQNNWTQVDVNSYNDSESALAFSWQNISVPAGGINVRSCIVKFGEVGPTPTLELSFQQFAEPFPAGDSMSVGVVSGGDLIRIVLIVDNFLNVNDVDVTFSEGSEVAFEFRPSDYQIGDGFHRLGFYGVDSEGDVSLGVFVNITIGTIPESEVSVGIEPSETHEPAAVNQVIPIVVAVGGALLVAAGTIAIFIFGRKHDKETRIGGTSSMTGDVLMPGYSET
jgi:hypothetical protein